MVERRLPLAVKDADGNHRHGEVVIVPSWRSEIEPSATADFTIVLSTTPLNGGRVPQGAPSVIVCSPGSPVRLNAKVAEVAATYDAGSPSGSLRLPRRALESFAAGELLAAGPLPFGPRDVFGNGGRPRLHLLAEHIVNDAGRRERYWQALGDVLANPRAPDRPAQPKRLRTALARALSEALAGRDAASGPATDAIARLRAVADGSAPDETYDEPRTLAEDAAYIRCLPEQSEAANELATMRAYIRLATEGARDALATDGLLALRQLSFTTLLDAPHQLASLRATFAVFRDRYAGAYATHHERYWRARSRLAATLREAEGTARALAGLNTLRGLGAPVGVAALERYDRLTTERHDCRGSELATALHERPRCPQCDLAIGDAPPADEIDETLRRLRGALAHQQSRLASEAVRRILARGGERLEQFLRIVQASDIAALVQVLDDDLLSFLHDLLAQPVATTSQALDLLDELARAHPEVDEDDVDAVVETLRQLLRDRVAADGDPFRLANEPPNAS